MKNFQGCFKKKKKNKEIDFHNSIQRLSFYCRLPVVEKCLKNAWMNTKLYYKVHNNLKWTV